MICKCSQCDKSAILKIQNNPLCVDCYSKFEQANSLRYAQLAALHNQTLDDIDDIAGLPVTSGRLKIPKPITVNTGQTTYNNIQVDNSVIGTINTGNIEKLDVMMSVMRNGNNQELANALQQLTQAIIDSSDLKSSDKDSAIEWLSYLSSQALTQETDRQSTIIRAAISTLEQILSKAGSVASIWSAIKPFEVPTFIQTTI